MKRKDRLLLELINERLKLVEQQVHELNGKVNVMSQQLADLKAQVERSNTVAQSAVTLIQGLAAQIASLKDDPAALQLLSDQLKAQSDSLAAAVSANTPAQ